MEKYGIAFAERFDSKTDLDDWLIQFYSERLDYFQRNMGRTTEHGTKITPLILRKTAERFVELLKKRSQVQNLMP
mgnify:CR=1 FL=1|tara:strand:+ start:5704 stop:5928 length:225 start_codon:yes stop_codon:yes gene_type:complete